MLPRPLRCGHSPVRLVEQCGFDRRALLRQGGECETDFERRLQRIGRDMSRRRRNEPVMGVDEGLDAEVAEDPLIDEAQFPRGTLSGAPVSVLAGALSLHTARPLWSRDSRPFTLRPVWSRGSRPLAPRPVAGRFEAEDGTRVPVDRVVGAVDAQLTAHPQMDEQAEFGRGLARTSRRPCSARTRFTRP